MSHKKPRIYPVRVFSGIYNDGLEIDFRGTVRVRAWNREEAQDLAVALANKQLKIVGQDGNPDVAVEFSTRDPRDEG